MSGMQSTTVGANLVVGVLGGMGPAATADFHTKLVRATPAHTDQQHLPLIIWSDPTVPDRSAALLNMGPDPTPWLMRGARALKAAGAGIIAVPCNTAHAFLAHVERETGVGIVHMIDETVQHIATVNPDIRGVGLLATTGTIRAHLYQDWLERAGYSVLLPTAQEQEAVVMRVIRSVKAGHHDLDLIRQLHALSESLASRGAQILIAGCTELPLVLGEDDIPLPVVDPGQILAHAVVRAAYRPGVVPDTA
ncbi:aspartate/glutamate racemase family protein [Streptosporangium sp. CA-115845]|uniref:aspartate/glutamate racemase family protein n=1 Tax=Streptosporangium sp. CA-115845 TaxID=3240071 RepID=UPI003D9079A2